MKTRLLTLLLSVVLCSHTSWGQGTANDLVYDVTFTNQWGEANLFYTGQPLSLQDYTAIRLEVTDPVVVEKCQMKVYGASDGKEQSSRLKLGDNTLVFSSQSLGGAVRRITLQCRVAETFTVSTPAATLLRKDGTQTPAGVPSKFWGCQVSAGMPSDLEPEATSRLVINELMQSNIDCVMDDLNEFPDSWVELYNPGDKAVKLSYFKLGLTEHVGEAWSLPLQSVSAHGRVLVCCDKENKGLHAPFRLESGKGCQVFLFKGDQVTDQVKGLKKQPAPNTSYGRATDGADQWGYMLTPTPLQANAGGTCTIDRVLPEPLFSVPGGVHESAQYIVLTLSMPQGIPDGAEIHYTTDGTEPTRFSPRYAVPIRFSTNTVLRARIFCQGWLSPPSTVHSYLFHQRAVTLPVVSIVTDRRYLDDSALGIIANNTGDKRNDWRRPVNIEFFFAAGAPAQINQLCEMRVSGGASRGAVKKSLALYANKRFGTKRFDYEFFPDQKPGLTDFKSLVLRNAGNDFDYLFMRDAIAQRTMATHADLDWQAWQPAIVYINGAYSGMLNIRERGNENNVYTNYDGLENIDLIENWWDLKEGDWEAYNRFKDFYSQPGHTMAEYELWMDCQEFINLMAMNLYFDNADFPGNNIIMWRPRTSNGRWRWIAKDVDYIMGLYNAKPEYKTLEWLYNPDYDGNRHWGANGESATLLFRRLMDDSTFQRTFIDHCAVYMGDFLNERGIRGVWDPMYQQISFEYPYHRKPINQWWPNYTDELNSARQWVSRRTKIFYQQLADFYHLGAPVPAKVTVSEPSDTLLQVLMNGVPLSEGIFDGYFFADREISLEGKAGAGWRFSGWRVVEQKGAGTTTTVVQGNTMRMAMPRCTQLTITPLLESEWQGIFTAETASWSLTRTGSTLTLHGVPAGTLVSLTDLRGIVKFTTIADGQTLLLPLNGTDIHLLRVGARTIKVVTHRANR